MQLEVITPEKIAYKDEVSQVTIPTFEGEITVLPHHINLVSKIVPGEMIIKKGKDTFHMAVTGGFLEIANNQISILAEYAIRSEEIEASRALEARKRAEEKMKVAREKNSSQDFALAEGELRRAILELNISNRRKRSTTQ